MKLRVLSRTDGFQTYLTTWRMTFGGSKTVKDFQVTKNCLCHIKTQLSQGPQTADIRDTMRSSQIWIIIISIQPLARFWQEPEPSQATSMALARCILGKFLGVVCHCFPLPWDIPTFAARCLHIPINASTPSSERWNCGQEWSSNFAKIMPFLRHLGIFYMLQICDMGQTALLLFRRKACWGFFLPEKSDGFGQIWINYKFF
jgi:hypothetical protein